MKIHEFFLTIYFWSLSVVCLLNTYVICLILYPFISQKTFARVYECMTGYAMLYLMVIPGFWSFKIIDHRQDKSWKNKRYIIVANHLSFVDSLVSSAIPVTKKFMIAEMFTKIPIFGWLARNAGFVAADRHKPEVNKDAVSRAIKTMEDGCSFMIYPLGMRQQDVNDLGKFKTGAYRIGYETQVPILPVTLKNTEKAMRIGAIVGFANIEVIIDEPFLVEHQDYAEYIDKTKEIISNRL